MGNPRREQADGTPFAHLLRCHRRAAGQTQAELAERANMSLRGVSDLECGVNRWPRRETVHMLADALDLSDDQRVAFLAAARRKGDMAGPPASPVISAAPRQLPVGGYLGALPAGPIVGREAEVARLRTLLETVASGAGCLALVAGEPGVGKTRLAQEVTREASSRGFVVATGRCYEPQASVAYYPFLEALTTAFAAAPTALREQLLGRLPEVARLMPDQKIGVDASPSTSVHSAASRQGGRDDQLRLFWQVTSLLQALAELNPLALLLDDLHWADSASLDLLAHLARHTHASRILLLGTYRDVEVDRQHPFQGVLRDLRREKLFERIEVRRLGEDGTRALLAAQLGPRERSAAFDDLAAFATVLHARAEGNPFFTCELVQALIERGDVFKREGHWDRKAIEEMEVPESIRSVIGQRLTHLASEVQEVLREASVLGQVFTFADLQSLSGQGEHTLESALQTAAEVALVHEAGRDRYTFHHALIQQALYHELPTRKRRRLHRLAGEALEKLPAITRERRAAELSYHFLEAEEGTRALPYALQAGEQAAAVYAHAEAERHYRIAAELAREAGKRAREAGALEKLGALLQGLGHRDEARDICERAALLWEAEHEGEGLARVSAYLIQLDLTPGVYPRGADRYRRLLRRLATFASHDQRAEVAEMESDKTQQTGESERPPQHDAAAELLRAPDIEAFVSPATAARVRLALAEKCTHLAIGVSAFGTSADEQLAGEFARRARLDAQLAGDIALEAQACDMYASILANAHTPHIAEALALGKEALRLAEASGDRGAYAGAATTVIILYGSSGAGAEAHRLQQRLVEVHEREQNPATLTSTITNLANSAYLLGEWEEAQRLLRRARAICPPHTDWLIWSNVLATDAMLAVAQGRPEADARVGEFLAAVDDQRSAYELLVQLAERDVLQDHPASACSRMEPLLGMHIGPGGFLHHLPQMAWATLVAGDEQGAAAYLQQAEEQLLWPIFRVDLMRVQALVATAQGRWQAAATALEDGLALARTMPYPYAEAKAFFVYGQLHAAKGEREWACEKYQAARAICARLGEGVYRPHIERALHELSTG